MKTWILPILSLITGLTAWHISVLWLGVPEFLLPLPRDVVFELLSRPEHYFSHTITTLYIAMTGLFIAICLGVGLAVLFVLSPTFERSFYPYILTIKITPTIALSPLLVLWLGIGSTAKIVIVVLICFFPIFVGCLKGFKSLDSGLVDLFRSLKATPTQTMLYLRLPSALPYLFPALRVVVLLSLTGALIGEFIASNRGIGYLILYSLRTYDSTGMFAGIVSVALVGFVLFWLVSFLERRVVFWQKHEAS